MRVGIVGHGYVGRGMRRLFQNRAEISIYDPHQLHNNEQGVLNSDLVLICVPTPQQADGSADVSVVKEVVRQFSKARLICIKSTVPPGTTESLIADYGDHIHFSPEYLGEGGNYVPPQYPDPYSVRSHPFCIVGGHRANDVMAFFQRVMATSARYVATSATAAELCKYMENTYLATKVAFCNEFASICESFGMDYGTVRELWLCDPRVDPSHTLVFKNQRGFNGKCLPKDLSAIRKAAEVAGVKTPLLDGVDFYNLGNREPVMETTPFRVHAVGAVVE